MPATFTAIPPDFLSGGKGLTPNRSAGSPDVASLIAELRTALGNTAAGVIQRGRGTLVAGTFTVATGVVITASSRFIVSLSSRPTVTTNYAGIAVTASTVGIAGVAAFTVEALVTAGTIDSDAVATVDWMIID